jgi:hypothetical protein
LPVDPNVECRERGPKDRTGGVLPDCVPELYAEPGYLLFGVDLNPPAEAPEDEDPFAVLVLEFAPPSFGLLDLDAGEEGAPSFSLSPLLGDLADELYLKMLLPTLADVSEVSLGQLLALLPARQTATPDRGDDPPGADRAPESFCPPLPKFTDSTCPYLQRTAPNPEAMSPDAGTDPDSVSENLEKLNRAHALYRKAEQRRRAGLPGDASVLYELVRRLCPGSRYDHLAARGLRKLQESASPDTGEEAGVPEGNAPPGSGVEPEDD